MGVNDVKRLVMIVLILFSACTGSTPEATEEISETPIAMETEAPAGSAPDGVEVELKNIQYSPKDVTVAAGGTVKWKNSDVPDHTVTFEDYLLDAYLKKGEETQRTFDTPGTYDYYPTLTVKD